MTTDFRGKILLINKSIINRLSSLSLDSTLIMVALTRKLLALGLIYSFELTKDSVKLLFRYVHGRPAFHHLRCVGKASCRNFLSLKQIEKGFGKGCFWLISTSKGILTREEALMARVGGVLLLQIFL